VARAMIAHAPVNTPMAKKNGCAHTLTHMPNLRSLLVLPDTKYMDVNEPNRATALMM